MATTAAKLMACEKYNPIIRQAEERLNDLTISIMETLPEDILLICQKYPRIFYASNDVHYYWNGKYYHVTLPFKIPSSIKSLDSDYYTADMKMCVKEACKAIFKAECERGSLEASLTEILIGLRTRARIEADFPEASRFIEWPENKQVPAVPVPNEIRKLFQKE